MCRSFRINIAGHLIWIWFFLQRIPAAKTIQEPEIRLAPFLSENDRHRDGADEG
jgi:hypothetical protein